MKKIFTLALAAVVSFTAVDKASAQDKGWWLGGTVAYAHDNTAGIKTDWLSIAPEAGYDFNKKWSVGVAVSYDYIKEKTESDKGSGDIFTVSPYARYTFCRAGILSVFVDGGVGFAFGDSDGFKAGLTPGLSVKITERVSFLTHIGFIGYRKDHFNGGNGESYGLKLSSSDLKFGFYYKF